MKEDGTRSVVFGGGVTSTQDDYSCEMFDPVAESWRSCPDTPHILVAPSRYSNKSLSIVQYVSEIAFHPPAFLMATPLSPSEAAKEATPDTPMPYTGISVAQLGFQTVPVHVFRFQLRPGGGRLDQAAGDPHLRQGDRGGRAHPGGIRPLRR